MPTNEEYLETIDEEVDDSTVMTVDIDETLSISGEAADAYVVGQRLIDLSNDIGDLNAATLPMSESDDTTISDKIGTMDSDIEALEGTVSGIGSAVTALDGAVVKSVAGITPTAGAIGTVDLLAAEATELATGTTYDALLAASADVLSDVDALFA